MGDPVCWSKPDGAVWSVVSDRAPFSRVGSMSLTAARVVRRDVSYFLLLPPQRGASAATDVPVTVTTDELERARHLHAQLVRTQRHLAIDAGVTDPPLDRVTGLAEAEGHTVNPFVATYGKNALHGSAPCALHAVGLTPESAIRHWCLGRGFAFDALGDALPAGDPAFTWGYRFTANGTGFKAAGWEIPGGVVMTWWK
jgi:hypothetical protein